MHPNTFRNRPLHCVINNSASVGIGCNSTVIDNVIFYYGISSFRPYYYCGVAFSVLRVIVLSSNTTLSPIAFRSNGFCLEID